MQADWRRLPLLGIVFFMARSLYQLGQNIMNALPGLAGILVVSEQIRAHAIWLVPLAVLAWVVIAGAVQYFCFRFRNQTPRIEIRQGVFEKVHLVLDYARIQQAEVTQPWYFRPFNLAVLSVDSAGSARNEVKLAGLPVVEAQRWRSEMLAVHQQAAPHEASLEPNSEANPAPSYQLVLGLAEVAKFGLLDIRTLITIPATFLLLFQFDQFSQWISNQLEQLVQDNFAHAGGFDWLAVSLALSVFIVLLACGYAVVRFYPYQFTIEDDRYQAQYGLLNKRSVTIRHAKLQRVQYRQNFIARWLRRHTIHLKQAQPHLVVGQSQNECMIPVATDAVVADFRTHFSQHQQHLVWQRTHAMTLWFYTLLGATPIAIGLWLLQLPWPQLLGYSFAALLSILWLCLRSWRWRGLYWNADWCVVRRGLIGSRQSWYPTFKIQQVLVSQSPWQRCFGCASILIQTAAGAQLISGIPYGVAAQAQQDILRRVRTSREAWL